MVNINKYYFKRSTKNYVLTYSVTSDFTKRFSENVYNVTKILLKLPRSIFLATVENTTLPCFQAKYYFGLISEYEYGRIFFPLQIHWLMLHLHSGQSRTNQIFKNYFWLSGVLESIRKTAFSPNPAPPICSVINIQKCDGSDGRAAAS